MKTVSLVVVIDPRYPGGGVDRTYIVQYPIYIG